MKRHFYLFVVIFLAGFLIRLLVCINAPMIEDERKNVLIAQSISFSPDKLNLPFEDSYVTHPLLNIYATKFSMSMFGETKFGIRFIHLIFGVLTLLVIYFLMREISKNAALLGMAIFAFNQFHIHASIRAENVSMLFFLLSLSLLVFWKVVKDNNYRMMLFVGPLCGLAFLTKGTSIFLVFVFLLYLLINSKQRFWFRTKELYISILLFLIVISPWLFWVSAYGSSQLIFQPEMYSLADIALRRTAVNFYLIKPISWLQGIDHRLAVSWEYTVMDGISGVILLLGVLWSIRYRKQDYHKLLLLFFFVIMGVLSFFTLPGAHYGEYWWAQQSLIPAVCLTSFALLDFASYKRIGKYLIVGILGYLILNSIVFAVQIKHNLVYPPHRFAARVDENLIVAEIHKDRGEWDEAIAEINRLLNISPNDVDDYSLLGWLYYQKGFSQRAMDYWIKALEILPDYVSPYNQLLERSNQSIAYYQVEVQNNNSVKAHYYLGVLHYYKGAYAQAMKEFNAVSEIEPHHEMAIYYTGLIQHKMAQFSKAIETFKQVIRLSPDSTLSHFHLGVSYLAAEKNDDAILMFKKALVINPDSADTHHQLGLAYERIGRGVDAQRAYKRARHIRMMI